MLYENEVLMQPGEPNSALRILWAPATEQVAVIPLFNQNAMPFWVPHFEVLQQIDAGQLIRCIDPMAKLIRPEPLTEAETEVRDGRWALIQPLVEDPERAVLFQEARGPRICQRALQAHVAKKTIYLSLSLFWRLGQQKNALVPGFANCGRSVGDRQPGLAKRGRPRTVVTGDEPRGINVDAEVKRKILKGLRYKRKDYSWQQAYVFVIFDEFSEIVEVDGVETRIPLQDRPSFDQFKYWILKTQTQSRLIIAQKGATKAARNHRPRLGNARDAAFGPGSVFEIDATSLDLYIVSRADRTKSIGRVTLYFIVDVYSFMIVGFHLGVGSPSWELGKLAFANAFSDKVAFCAKFGIQITNDEWLSHHLCAAVAGDGGSEVVGFDSSEAAQGLSVRFVTKPPERPDLKASVECTNFLMARETKTAPGAIKKRERGDKKEKVEAVLTIENATKRVIEFILFHNNSQPVKRPPSGYPQDHKPPTPVELWKYGCIAQGAPRVADPAWVQANLLHTGVGRLSSEGLVFNGLHYAATNVEDMPELQTIVRESLEEGFWRRKGRKWAKDIKVKHDIRDVSTILLPVGTGSEFLPLELIARDRRYQGWTLEEVKDDRSARAIGEREAREHQLLRRIQMMTANSETDRVAKAERGNAPLTTQQPKGDQAARAAEKRAMQREGAWTSRRPEPPAPTTETPKPSVPAAPANDAKPRTNDFMVDILRAARANKR